ncbi:MAG: hypothetical protein COA78_17930 [Blastopirellula sp.]|nr:MAG: hypothetical protein COA78_17930 [Blastopirellula sp.]
MSEQGTITRWIFNLAEDNDEAVCRIWQQYFSQLVQLARKQLNGRQWGGVDEEDVALSALDAFITQHNAGKYPDIQGRDDVWKLLAVITRRKALNVIRSEMSQRRGGGKQTNLSDALMQSFEAGPSPLQAAELLDEARRLIDHTLDGRSNLQVIATRKLQGANNTELAEELKVSRRTIERKLEVIRMLWQEDLESRELMPGIEKVEDHG